MRIAITVLLAIVLVTAASAPSAWTTRANGTRQQGDNINVEIVLDVSGSMAQVLSTGDVRMDAAKAVLNNLVKGIPDTENINVGLRIYGHEGNNTAEGQAVSCQSSELVVPIEGVEKDAITTEIANLQPTGWTPLALSLQEAEGDFPIGDDETNAVVLVTDGLETCGGDPCATAADINTGDAAIVTHVVGFGITLDEQRLLECIAESGQGLRLGARNAEELTDALFTVFVEELDIPVTLEPQQTTPIRSGTGTYEIGETFEINSGQFEMSVTGYSEFDSFVPFSSVEARGKYVAVEMVVSVPGRTSAVLDYRQFRLYTVSTDRLTEMDPDATIPAQIGLYGVGMFDDLRPGLEYTTVVVFDVADDSEGYRLRVGGRGDSAHQDVRLSGNSVPE